MDFYEILGVSSSASVNDIRRAYQNKLFKLRSEHAQTDNRWQKQTLERSRLILQAYQVLRDPAKRANYDQERRINRATGTTAYRAPERRAPVGGTVPEAAATPAAEPAGGADSTEEAAPDNAEPAPDTGVAPGDDPDVAAGEGRAPEEEALDAEGNAEDGDTETRSMGEELAAEAGAAGSEPKAEEEDHERHRGPVLALLAIVALIALGAGFLLRNSLTPAPATETASASLDYDIHYAGAGDLRYSGGPSDKLAAAGNGVQAHVGAGSKMAIEPQAGGRGVTVRLPADEWQGSGRVGLSTDGASGPIGFSASRGADGRLSVQLDGSQPQGSISQPSPPSGPAGGEQTLTMRVDSSGAHYAVNGKEVGHSGPLGGGDGSGNVNITIAASSDSAFDVGLSRVEVLTSTGSAAPVAAGPVSGAGGEGQPAATSGGCGLWGTIHAAIDWSRVQPGASGLDLSGAAQLRGSGPEGAAMGATFGPLLVPEPAAGMSMGAAVGGLLGLASSRIPDLVAAVPAPAAQSLADRLQASFDASASCGAAPREAANLPPYFSTGWLQGHPATDVPPVTARGVLVVDRDSQQIIYAKNPDQPRPPASVMKIVTAMTALELARPDQQVAVSDHAAAQPPHRMGLKEGERLSVQDLLYGLLLDSGNDAAEALADGLPGGREQFLERMNGLPLRMGLRQTHFVDPSGLSDDDVTTPYEMAALAGEALSAYPTLARIAATKQTSIPATTDHGAFTPTNLNTLLNDYPGTYGLKDGNTDAAGYNLVLASQKNGRNVIVVLLGSEHHFADGAALMDWAYAHFPEPDGAPVRRFDSDRELS